MNEIEKMLAGELYDANYNSELTKKRLKAKELCKKYNDCDVRDSDTKKAILEQLFGKKIDILEIEPNFYCDYGFNIYLGKNFYSNHNLVILDCAEVIFGDNVFIGPNCAFYTPQHPLDAETRITGLEYAFPIKVGNNVWFGGNVVVLPNITIGDNVVIGAGSIVTKNIPSNVIAVGNPCKIIRKITKEDKHKFEK